MIILDRNTHPLADAFPLMDDATLNALADDIDHNGLRMRILLHPDGRILDGRNRGRAVEIVNERRVKHGDPGITAEFETFYTDDELVCANYVWSVNASRRMLNPLQAARAAKSLAKLITKRKERVRRNLELPMTDADYAVGEQMGEATEAVMDALTHGEITLTDAVMLSKQDPDVQDRAIAELRKPDWVTSVELKLNAADLAVLRAAMGYLRESPSGQIRAGAMLIGKLVPGV